MDVRDARPSDAAAIREVHVDAIRGLAPRAYDPEQVDAWAEGCHTADYVAAIESDDLEYVVAEDAGGIVGFGSLKTVVPEGYATDVEAEVTAVYVDPSVAREGVGGRIYAELQRRARERGVETLGLTASLNAVPFYEAEGYERVREYDHEFSSHESTGVTGTVVEMTKDL